MFIPSATVHIDATRFPAPVSTDRAFAKARQRLEWQIIARRQAALESLAEDILTLSPDMLEKRARAILSARQVSA